MKTAGCISLSYGVESGSQKIINDMKKNFTIDTAKAVLEATCKAGIKIHLQFIVGYPTENEQDFKETLKFSPSK